MKTLVVLSGAGVSAESGIPVMTNATTWRGYQIHEVASQEKWDNEPQLLIDFYNERRREFAPILPNDAHKIIKELELQYKVYVITTNVDNLHEKAGSKNVIHLHGNITKVQSEKNPKLIYDWNEDLKLGDVDENGHQLRPNVVFFGETMPTIEPAVKICSQADVMIIVGSAMQVYPAAILYTFAPKNCKIYVVNPVKPNLATANKIEHIAENAVQGMKAVYEKLKNEA
ncbi:MAG: SIR2 family NAD-dependent protein deacylase [Flavobacteriaceae bacterium]